ncbi:hypothetical protein TVWG_00011 [Tetraselmis viridis virus N1]|uniref:Uncharacterized protein n=1 Tax=Tetraselmis viridis virus S1 TaxID=756285 RepID=M4QR75_9VIRU|nr:hypothetical protein TVSG_00014 [Tetraselmis viridis virus S1]AET84776.1 hypothetical protein TVWG_00011 [Tetraselmis viridis virus N1]AGH30814.1 hypothetical protein TVSG_00014 [Tetraselmis viridis virus S1]
MGFKEEVKVYLSTKKAETSADRSRAKWVIKDPVRPPNSLYRMKLQLANAIIPNRFVRISERAQNNKMIFLYDPEFSDDGVFTAEEALAAGTYLTVAIEDIENPDKKKLYDAIRKAMIPAFDNDFLIGGQPRKPMVEYDEDTEIMTFRFVDWENTPELPTPDPEDPQVLEGFKIMTYSDWVQAGKKYVTQADFGLSGILGLDAKDPGIIEDGEVLTVDDDPNLTGTQFIKLMTNLNINNIDPNTLAYTRLMGVIPVTDNEDESSVVYMAGGIQNPQYQTIGDPELKIVEIELRDDNDVPLAVGDDWYVELSILFEEEEKTDVYRGLSALTGPAANVDRYDGAGYARLGSEMTLRKRLSETRDEETMHRDDHRPSGTRRRF